MAVALDKHDVQHRRPTRRLPAIERPAMNLDDISGALLPIWILGVPLLLAVIDLMRTPNPNRR
jgi:hypothetical protein